MAIITSGSLDKALLNLLQIVTYLIIPVVEPAHFGILTLSPTLNGRLLSVKKLLLIIVIFLSYSFLALFLSLKK
jgi:hypothetical protein